MFSAHLQFEFASVPITQPITKFGGEPVWIDEPAWPRSRSSNNLMFFIGQVGLDRRLFPLAVADMAYIFMTDDPGADFTWDPDAGENSVVLQSYRNPPIKITDTKPGAPRNVERDALTKLTFV